MFSTLFKRSEDFSHIDLLFISKDDCHLCDEALAVVQGVRRDHPFAMTVIKIERGDQWYDRYWDKIPVVLINGRMGFKYRVERGELLKKLRAHAGERNR